MLRFAPLFVGALGSVKGSKASLSLLGNQRCSSSRLLLPPCPDIECLCCNRSRDTPSGLPSLATSSCLLSQEGFSSKDQAPCDNSVRHIGEVREWGHAPFSALLVPGAAEAAATAPRQSHNSSSSQKGKVPDSHDTPDICQIQATSCLLHLLT